MPRITDDALRQVKDALRQYEAEVRASDLTDTTKHTYTTHARRFVSWLDHGYTPPGIGLQ